MQGVYLIHLAEPLGNPESPYGQARHYLGWASDIARRLQHHREGTGARLLAAANERGIAWECVRRWKDATRADERRLKDRHDAPSLCPICRCGADAGHVAGALASGKRGNDHAA